MEMETKIQRALNIIEKRPGIRTEDLAKAVGVESAKIPPLIYAATSNGFVLLCKVERPGRLPTTEYRLQAGVVARDWDNYRSTHTAERTKAKKPLPYRRDTQQPSIEQRAVEIAVDRHSRAAKAEATAEDLQNKIEGMAEQIANLQVALDVAQQTIHRMELEAEQTGKGSGRYPGAIGYLIRVPKRDPRLLTQRQSAIQAAQAAAKTAGRADVLALVPVGTARRKVAASVAWSEN